MRTEQWILELFDLFIESSYKLSLGAENMHSLRIDQGIRTIEENVFMEHNEDLTHLI